MQPRPRPPGLRVQLSAHSQRSLSSSPALIPKTRSNLRLRVNATLVVIRAEVPDKQRMFSVSSKEEECLRVDRQSFFDLSLTQPYIPKACCGLVARDLKASDFHLFLDGAEVSARLALVPVLASRPCQTEKKRGVLLIGPSSAERRGTSDLGQDAFRKSQGVQEKTKSQGRAVDPRDFAIHSV